MAEVNSGIYAITNTINGKQYIGSAKNLVARWSGHKQMADRGRHHSPHFQAAWNKYGADAFRFDVLEYVDDIERLIEREQFHMDERKSATGDNGYNGRPCAKNNLGYRRTEESKRAMSTRYKGREITWRDKLCGPKTVEHRRKISEIASARKWPEDHKAHLSAVLKGRPKKPSTRERMKAYWDAHPEERATRVSGMRSPEAIEKARQTRKCRPPSEKQLAYWNRAKV